MGRSIHDFVDDPRNADIRIWINGTLKSRAEATVSVFDSGFVLGDGVWEGFRLVRGRIVFAEAHLRRLEDGAKAIALDIGLQDNLITSNRVLVEAMTRFGIAHTFETYEGDHGNRIPQRLEEKVLPFFSKHLK